MCDVAEHLEVSVADSTVKWCSYLGKLMAVFYELNRQLSYAPSTLPTYPMDTRTYIHKNTCKRMFIAALFIVVPKLEKSPISINRRINKLWYSYTVEFCSVIKSNKLTNIWSNMYESQNMLRGKMSTSLVESICMFFFF